jgi:dihydroxy-acid dehydratase
MIGHVSPEAALGGPIAAIREGDIVHVDINKRLLNLSVTESDLRQRSKDWQAPPARYTSGVFAKYAALVSSASSGAITRPR